MHWTKMTCYHCGKDNRIVLHEPLSTDINPLLEGRESSLFIHDEKHDFSKLLCKFEKMAEEIEMLEKMCNVQMNSNRSMRKELDRLESCIRHKDDKIKDLEKKIHEIGG